MNKTIYFKGVFLERIFIEKESFGCKACYFYINNGCSNVDCRGSYFVLSSFYDMIKLADKE